MSGILAFSFPCILGAGIALPGKMKAEVMSKQDSLIHIQNVDSQMIVDTAMLEMDSKLVPQLSTDK